MADLHQMTLDKKKNEDRGYKYISLWECYVDRQIRDNKLLQTIESLDMVPPLDPQDAFYGGRIEVFTLFKEAENVISLYPFIHKTGTIDPSISSINVKFSPKEFPKFYEQVHHHNNIILIDRSETKINDHHKESAKHINQCHLSL